jgi:hypothetical protein
MSTQPWWEPTWKRLLAVTAVLFVVILLFLAGRVHAGSDPALARSVAPRVVATPTPEPPSYGFDPYQQQQPADPQQLAPPTTHAS